MRLTPAAVSAVAVLASVPSLGRAQEEEPPAIPRGAERLQELAHAAGIDWVEAAGGIPAAAHPIPLGTETFWVPSDGRRFWTRDPEIGTSVVEARGRLPATARLVPAGDLWAIEDLASPSGWALLVPGMPWAWTSMGPVLLERAPAGGNVAAGPTPPTRADVEATVAVRGMRTCPSGRGPCVVYGPLGDVQTARDPRHPMWGYVLEVRAAPALLPGVGMHGEVARDGDAAVEVDTFPVIGDPWTRQPNRVWLVLGDRRVHAFDATFLQGFEPRWDLVRYGGDLVVIANDGYRIALSRHDPQTGVRRGAATRVEAVPYYHDCDDGQWLEPVLTARGVGFVLVFADDDRTAVYWPSATAQGREVSIRPAADGDYGTVVRYTFDGNGLRPVGR